MTTAIVDVREWLVAALLGDAALVALLGNSGEEFAGVYDEGAPEGAPFDYVVIGNTDEARGPAVFAGGLREGGEDIRIHTRPAPGERVGSSRARRIYAELVRILDGASAGLPGGFQMQRGRLRLTTTFLEPDRVTTSAPARFTFTVSAP